MQLQPVELVSEHQAALALNLSLAELRQRIEAFGLVTIPAQTMGKRLAGLITSAGYDRLWREKIQRS